MVNRRKRRWGGWRSCGEQREKFVCGFTQLGSEHVEKIKTLKSTRARSVIRL